MLVTSPIWLKYFPTVRSVIYPVRVTVGQIPESVVAMMAADAASAALGIDLVECTPGRARTRMTVRADMVNGHALAHGGLVFTLADTAFACACNGNGGTTVAAGAEIVFVAPARLGDVLEAEAVERTSFGRNGVYDVTVRRGDEILAEFRGHSHRVADRT
jgi:acyl-CoA thioesterase